MRPFRREEYRTRMNRNCREFCRLEVELSDTSGSYERLSICGTEGYIVTPKQARTEALDRMTDWHLNDYPGIDVRPAKGPLPLHVLTWARTGLIGLEGVAHEALSRIAG